MRIGAKLPDFGPDIREVPLGEAARLAEDAGFDSVWVTDHVVMVENANSPYPFSHDGAITWDPAEPRYDAIVALATAAAATRDVEIGAAVLIAALRNPLVLAKQLASVDVLSGGRLSIAVGAGWLAEEFAALGVPFDTRGARLNEWIDILRDCWTGTPRSRNSDHYRIPEGVLCYPTPAHAIPILVGGMSKPALRRAGRQGDGWLAFQRAETIDLEALRTGRQLMAEQAHSVDRQAERTVVRLTGSVELAVNQLSELESAGVTDLIVEVDWRGAGGPERTLDVLRNASRD